MTFPTSGDLALALMVCQRASGGSQKTLAARYSSRFSAASACCGSTLMNHSLLGSEKPNSSCSRFSSKASEMYLRMRPRQTCLYSEASMCPRILSAAAQSWASKFRPESLDFESKDFTFAMTARVAKQTVVAKWEFCSLRMVDATLFRVGSDLIA